MSFWTVSRVEEFCGSAYAPEAGCVIAPNEPMQVFGRSDLPLRRRMKRCVAHATEPVNWSEVELERFRLDREEALDRERADWVAQQTRPLPPRRPRPAAPVKKFEKVSAFAGSMFDGKAAACGREND